MRWKKPITGQKRIKRCFLFTPFMLNDEMRWLEYTSWIEEYHRTNDSWMPLYWEDKNPDK